MSLDFDGSNDVVTRASVTLGSYVTYYARFYADDQGESDAGMLVGHGDGATEERTGIYWNGTGSSEKLQFIFGSDGTDEIIEMTTGFAAVTGWKGIVAAMDLTGVSVRLHTHSDGVMSGPLSLGAGLTEVFAFTGNARADGETLRVGCNQAGGQAWNGRIAEFAVWTHATRTLTDNEAAAVLVNGPMAVPGMYLYWPLGHAGTADATDFSGNGRTGTISGAILGENPPMRPCGRRG